MGRNMKYAAVALLSSAVLLLAACSGNKKAMEGASADNTAAYALAKNATYQTDSAGFRVNPLTAPANQTYYFAFDNSEVRSQDMKALSMQANYLASHPDVNVRLEGDTDNRGSREYNIGLGWRRDQTVARILEQAGVRANQIDMVSYGKQNPVASGNTESAWALNRRVELVYK